MTQIAGSDVLVTGGTGFLGKFVVEEVTKRGARLVLAAGRADADLRQWDEAHDLFKSVRPNIVIHLAAVVGGIGANRTRPADFFSDNMRMGMNVLEAARAFGVEKVVTAGTICSYPKHTPVPFKEESLWDGYPEETNAPYGIAKKALLVMGQAYRQQWGMNCVFLMPVNLYGPGDNFNLETSHVIPAMIRKFVEARAANHAPVDLWGTGAATREFLHVRDAARAFADAAEKYDKPEPVNIGAGFEIDVKGLALMIQRIVGHRGEIRWDATKPDGQPRRRLDVSGALREFGWSAQILFGLGLQETVRWYLSRVASNVDVEA